MQNALTLAVVQMTSTNTHAGNIETLQRACAEAAEQGAQMIAFPEVAGLMNRRIEAMRAEIVDETRDPFIAAAQEAAASHGLWVHTGSTPVLRTGETRFFNHSSLIDPNGMIAAGYDKIHLFDYFPDGGKPIVESRRFAPGTQARLARTPWGPLGMSVCYDLRFPALYRAYAKAGATLLFIPSAFTPQTGKAHWHTLLKARAIENGVFVIAAAQTGTHDDGRQTYGHSLVVAPTGQILLDMETPPGMALVTLAMEDVQKARTSIPSLNNERIFTHNFDFPA